MSWNALGPGQTKTNKIITDSTGYKLVTLPPCKIYAHANLHLHGPICKEWHAGNEMSRRK